MKDIKIFNKISIDQSDQEKFNDCVSFFFCLISLSFFIFSSLLVLRKQSKICSQESIIDQSNKRFTLTVS